MRRPGRSEIVRRAGSDVSEKSQFLPRNSASRMEVRRDDPAGGVCDSWTPPKTQELLHGSSCMAADPWSLGLLSCRFGMQIFYVRKFLFLGVHGSPTAKKLLGHSRL